MSCAAGQVEVRLGRELGHRQSQCGYQRWHLPLRLQGEGEVPHRGPQLSADAEQRPNLLVLQAADDDQLRAQRSVTGMGHAMRMAISLTRLSSAIDKASIPHYTSICGTESVVGAALNAARAVVHVETGS